MTENTPSTNQISYGWVAFRGETRGISSDAAYAEFDRWLNAHDQGIRDAVRPSTPAELVEAAWEAAYEVPEGYSTVPRDRPEASPRGGAMSGSKMHEITGKISTLSDGSTLGTRFLIEVELDEQVEIYPPLGTPATLAWDGTAFIIPPREER